MGFIPVIPLSHTISDPLADHLGIPDNWTRPATGIIFYSIQIFSTKQLRATYLKCSMSKLRLQVMRIWLPFGRHCSDHAEMRGATIFYFYPNEF